MNSLLANLYNLLIFTIKLNGKLSLTRHPHHHCVQQCSPLLALLSHPMVILLLCLGWSLTMEKRDLHLSNPAMLSNVKPVAPLSSQDQVSHCPEQYFIPVTKDTSQTLTYFPKAIPLIIHVEWKPKAFWNIYCPFIAGKLVTGSASLKSPAKSNQIFLQHEMQKKNFPVNLIGSFQMIQGFC